MTVTLPSVVVVVPATFARPDEMHADEKVTVNVAIELRGIAPGTREGGVVEHQVHEVELECPAETIPEKLQLTINSLQLDRLALTTTAPPRIMRSPAFKVIFRAMGASGFRLCSYRLKHLKVISKTF